MSRPPAHLSRLAVQHSHTKLKQRNTSHAIPTDYAPVEITGLARKAPSFRAGMDSAEAEGLRWVQSGVACCSMYCRIMLIGAPPQDAAKYDGDQRTPFQYRRSRSFRSFLSNRLDTPFRLLTRADTATFGGYSTNK